MTKSKHLKKFVFIIITLFSLNACNSQNKMIDKTVVKELNIQEYLGTWYEIARFDHKFERGLVGVTADYSFREDGKIKVLNSGFKNTLNGQKSEAVGKAKIPDPAIPSKLKVSFFWIFYADYFVLELEKDYKWAVIGSKSDSYLWILSRTPQLDEKTYLSILDKITDRGYDVNKLIKVEQSLN